MGDVKIVARSTDKQERDKISRWDAGRQFLMDAIRLTRKPDGCVVMLVMMDKSRELIQEFRDKQQPMTYTPLIVRACALALRRHPWMHSMIRGRKVVEPANVEIGISVASKESVTPVVVISDPDKKSLVEIGQELRERSRGARKWQEDSINTMRRYGRFIPAALRTLMARLFMRSQRARRHLVGTFQITSVAGRGIEIAAPFVLTSTTLLSLGHITERAVVVDGKVEAKLCVYIAILPDHRLVDGGRAWEFLSDVRALLEEPSSLM